jgi:peptide subunit release factor 1 (eRF1)
MITRDEIRELANFHSPETCALTFYYQPSTPQDLSHRGESIMVKDLVRNAMRDAEKGGKNGCARADLERISGIIEALHGNGGKAKAIFACAGQNFWREYDLPPQLPKTQVIFNQRFHLKPLAALLREGRKTLIVLADRTKARVFELSNDEITELQDFFNQLTRRGKSDGFAGYDAGHAERRVMNETAHHFKAIADYVKERYEREPFDQLLIGCHDEQWPEIEVHLHTYAKQKLIGHFRIDPKVATPEQVKETALHKIAEHENEEKQRMISEVIGEAHRNGNGAIGLRRVLRSLEVGEVQTLLLGSNFQAPGVKCYNCGHMDLHDAPVCAVCGKPNTQLEDIGDAIVGEAIRNHIEILWIDNTEEFDSIGRIAALLRFRADQNTPMKVAV